MRNTVVKLLVLAVGLSAVAALRLLAAGPAEGWTPALMMKVKRIGSVQVSPNGDWVVFTVREAVMEGNRSEYRTQFHLADAKGESDVQLTQGGASCEDPQWSPDGRWIAFLSEQSGKKNLRVIRPNGGEAQQVSDVKSGVGNFKWSPDGKQLAFTALDAPTAEEDKAAGKRTTPESWTRTPR